MQLVINGQPKEFPELEASSKVSDLIAILGLKNDRVAIEQNGEIVSRASWTGNSCPIRRQAGNCALRRRWMLLMRARPWLHLAIFCCMALGLLLHAQIQHQGPRQTPPMVGPTLIVPASLPGAPMKLIAYGDIRFTDPANVTDTNPKARQFLVKQVADEKPLAIFLTGDTPFTGSDPADWKVFQQETAAWRDQHVNVFPTMGNHEAKGGYEAGTQQPIAPIFLS